MAKIGFLKKGLAGSEKEKSKNLADANKEIYKKEKESKTLEKNAKMKQKELKKKEKKAFHSKKKVKPNKSKKTLGGKKQYDWSEETKSEYGENKETYIQLHVESDQNFKELLLDIYFDENAPNFFTNENKMRWRPTADEMDSILEAFDILSQSSVSLEKKIDKLSKEFYFNPEKIEVEPPTSDSEQKEIDISPMSGDVFNKEQEQGSEDLKKNTEDGTLVNLEKKTDDLSESDKLSEVFKTPSEESPKIEEVVFNPEKIEVEPPNSDSEQEEMHSRPRLDKVLFRRVEKT
jgi:hypothetical protein